MRLTLQALHLIRVSEIKGWMNWKNWHALTTLFRSPGGIFRLLGLGGSLCITLPDFVGSEIAGVIAVICRSQILTWSGDFAGQRVKSLSLETFHDALLIRPNIARVISALQ